ncbi:MAG: cysteine desulfurase [Lachnospiraceae bacterium]|nr:cysteine desulfurase [Lachnospiraceae bacterium]
MEAYLDNSATTRCHESIKDKMVRVLTEDFGNPSSMHIKGIEAERYVKEASDIIAKVLKVDAREIVYTSGGTESDNLALIGVAEANKRAGKHIITTVYEHPAILETCKYLEEQGYEVTYIPVDEYGVVRLPEFKAALKEDTILVSMMYVNNEIGAVLPVEEVSKIIKDFNKNIIFHVDAVQGFGKYPIFPKKQGIDMLSVSGHKIHGPKGIGFLYVSDKVKLKPILYGGGQQKGMRSGTENVPGITGLGIAVSEICHDLETKADALYKLKEGFVKDLEGLDGVTINGYTDRRSAPHIVSASFEGVRSEVLLHALEDKGIYVSAGSACASNKKKEASKTLVAIGLKKELLDSTIRFSFSFETTKEELDYTVDVLKQVLPTLRKYTRH